MNYGHFDDAAREYVITRPDTPRAWSNYLGDRRYGAIITNNAGGYSFTRSPASGRFLRHRYNAVPMDMPGRQFYLRDQASGDYWSAAWQPVGKPLEQYKTATRFGPGYAVIESEYSGIKTAATYFVPLNQDFEYWHLKVTNTGSEPRKLSVFSYCEFTTEWNLTQDTFNLQYAQYISDAVWKDGTILASSCKRLPEDPGNFSNNDQSRWWWMTQVGGTIAGFDCERKKFLGVYRSYDRPEAVERGACGNHEHFSDNGCGVIQSDLTLAPGESTDVIVLLGIGKGAKAKSIRAKFANVPAVERELAKLKKHWHGLLDVMQVKTPDADFDHMTNVWGAYNALMTFEWSRSCSLVYTGDQRDGFGFRDTVQDFLGVTHMMPDAVRERMILMLSAQDSTGGAQPEVRPWSHVPGKMKPTPASHYRSDDCQWFFNSVPAYVAESGDTKFYDLVVPYADKGKATVFGHLRRALEFNLERTGKHGLPCGLLADWNDCLKLGYKGESVFVTFQLRFGLKTYAEIATQLGKPKEAKWALAELAKLDKKIAKVCWDGGWFIWAISEDGVVFGTKKAKEGQIYVNTQVWAVLSGAATPEQTDKALAAVQQRLASDYGVALCNPPFDKTPVKVMRAVLFNPGNKENGGIFSHTQSWVVLAEIARGNGDAAYRYYRSFMPSAQNDQAEVREIEPYVHCQSTHAPASKKYGKSRVPWLSGTASWSHYTATQYILGIRPELGGLRIDPCIPTTWPGFTAKRTFRGKALDIEVQNPSGVSRGVKSLTVDGVEIKGNLIPAAKLKKGAKIVAILG
ncbi:MAG TPA: N,N'-diacetylchitobiose phosphorylase [Opitutaceae bacterium]|nr:N,N'-diacetylchitobiose phosphorylase [Opitutaceae bacterium]HOR26302.1 N,N'-diacetylchitobiose phosphorylase [Opitutaceae bacterium]HPK50590.1 N,N'-diacetylchitobiose phosphorylase [Opitutaceae bacterium]